MGQALYRKYRSKNLNEVVGQEHITSTLGLAIRNGNISHAYLLTGPRGVGKTSVARILAHEVNGLPYDEDSTHLDIIEIDAASNRRIDEIRELRDKVHIAPAVAKYKVYIIDEVHMLTREAFNALLKTLEEPPAHAIFILATTEAYKLPETIVSRTQRYTFRPIDQTKVIEHLKNIAKKEKIAIEDNALEIIARHGEGSFRDSISLLDQLGSSGQKITASQVLEVLGEAPTEQIRTLTNSLGHSSSEVVQTLHDMLSQGYEPARIAKQLSQQLRNELLNGSSRPEAVATLSLLDQLLEVPRSSDPAVALEICLLKAVNSMSPTTNITKIRPVPPQNPIKKDSTPKDKESSIEIEEQPASTQKFEKPLEPTKVLPKKNDSSEVVELGDNLEEVWQQVMIAIKKHHNTLYSVMRMARPVWANDGLKLHFGFSFHQKRINEPKNRETIAKIIEDITGRKITVSSVLDENMKPTVESDDSPSQPSILNDPVLTNISDIFGGAELVES